MKVVCFGCCKSSYDGQSRFYIFDCGCQVCHTCLVNSKGKPGCYYCKLPSAATQVTENLPFRLKKFLMPIKYAFDVYRGELDEIMEFQQSNNKNLRKHLKQQKQPEKKGNKKLVAYVKRATYKVKQQNGTLKKLHRKIITYERMVGEVRKKSQANRRKKPPRSSSLGSKSNRGNTSMRGFGFSDSILNSTLNGSAVSGLSQLTFNSQSLNESIQSSRSIRSSSAKSMKSATSSIRNARVGNPSTLYMDKTISSSTFQPKSNSTLLTQDIESSMIESGTMFPPLSVAKSGLAVNKKSFCHGKTDIDLDNTNQTTLSTPIMELVKKYAKKN